MSDRNWITAYFVICIFFGLSTGAGLAMREYSIWRFIFVLTGLTLLVALSFLNFKVGKIMQKL